MLLLRHCRHHATPLHSAVFSSLVFGLFLLWSVFYFRNEPAASVYCHIINKHMWPSSTGGHACSCCIDDSVCFGPLVAPNQVNLVSSGSRIFWDVSYGNFYFCLFILEPYEWFSLCGELSVFAPWSLLIMADLDDGMSATRRAFLPWAIFVKVFFSSFYKALKSF